MTKLALISVVFLTTMSYAVPASAQQVISNPGYCAQFYPNANCNDRGPNSPYTGDYQRRGGTSGPLGFNNPEWNGGYERPAKRGRYSDNGGYRRAY